MRYLSVTGDKCSLEMTNPGLCLLVWLNESKQWVKVVWIWRYLTSGLIWHLSRSSIRPSIYFSLIVKSSSNPFLEPPTVSNKDKVSCSKKQRGPLMGLEHTTSTLRRAYKLFHRAMVINRSIVVKHHNYRCMCCLISWRSRKASTIVNELLLWYSVKKNDYTKRVYWWWHTTYRYFVVTKSIALL